MHFHPAKTLIASSIMMMMAVYLIIGSLWVIFGIAFESAAVTLPSYGIVITTASIVWSAISLIISIYFIHQVRSIMKRVKHEGKT